MSRTYKDQKGHQKGCPNGQSKCPVCSKKELLTYKDSKRSPLP
jgi:hypothetical protein